MDNPRQRYRALSAESLSAQDPTGWFERLYGEAEAGEAQVPWDRSAPHPLLASWAESRRGTGDGKRALIVGCGPGDDAELVSALGYDTVAFDISEAAIRTARQRYPQSKVEYLVADLFNPPASWERTFDLVVEVFTVQALPVEYHPRLIDHIGRFVGGTLLVIAAARDDDEEHDGIPPWPLTRAEVESFTGTGLRLVSLQRLETRPGNFNWRAEFMRPHAA
jgi:SAM-dependent methyltransferase